MPIYLVSGYFLLPNPIGPCAQESLQITPDGLSPEPGTPSCYINQGDDPPYGGSGGKRPLMQTLHGTSAADLYRNPITAQLQERIQFRVAQIASLLAGGITYALPEDEFAQGFDLPVEIQALHRIVERKWGDEDVTRSIDTHAWIIRLTALKAYVAVHTKLMSVNLNDQRTALGCLRNWFYLGETSLANASVKAYEELLSHIIEYNSADPQCVTELLEKERKALQASLIEHTDASEGRERDQNALTFVNDKGIER